MGLSKFGSLLRSFWRVFPLQVRQRLWRIANPVVWNAYARATLARPASTRQWGPVVVAGLFSTASGLGEAARSTWRALDSAGCDPIAVDLTPFLAPSDLKTDIPLDDMPTTPTGTLILQVNGPEVTAALHHLGMKRGRNWYTIGYWAWELAEFPPKWERALPYLSALWTISDFCRDAFSKKCALPIDVFPHPVRAPSLDRDACRSHFGFPPQAFITLAMADALSSLERKNPIGAILAHEEAFGDDPDRILVVKSRNLDYASGGNKGAKRLYEAVANRSNVQLLDRVLTEADQWQLIFAADAVLSLHRSEGYGLVLAEAMIAGRPVIATGYSGNMMFMTDDTSYPIGFDLVPVNDPTKIYRSARGVWADPSLSEAASVLLQLAGKPPEISALSDAARRHMSEVACTDRIGQRMRRAVVA